MGLISKLMFWKKKKEETSDYDEVKEDSGEYPPQINPKLDYGAGQMQQTAPVQQPSSDDREFKILSDKLDVIMSRLDLIDRRIQSLEERKPKEIVQRW